VGNAGITPAAAAAAMNERPVIIGWDAVSPLGVDLPEQWRRAVAGQSGVGPLTRFTPPAGFPVAVAGQVPPIDTRPFAFLSARALAQWTSPVFAHALLVVHRALERAGLAIDARLAPRVAVTFSSAVGGQDAVLQADRRMRASGKLPPPFTNPNACINMVGGKVSMLTGASGPILSTITACATGATSLAVGALLIAQDLADVAICGAVDFALVEPIVAGFATMNGAYRSDGPAPPEAPQRASRPFAPDRRGFVVAEGAACLLLARRSLARERGLDQRVELAGWAMTSDAHHFVAPHRPTVTRCMAQALASAGIGPAAVDAVNAHAASTKVGDRVEVEALRDLFGERLPPLTANKSLFGHAMGASSALETVLAIEGLLADTLPPTINYAPDPELSLGCVSATARPLRQSHVLKNAFGFGGCNTCLVLRRMQ
jgi:3-oxoacyl-[acyl-carrier-protein] synthase II